MGAQPFLQVLQDLLSAHPAGLSEYDLIKQLEARGEAGFTAGSLRDNLSLFQTHFLLFHNLYLLDEQLSAAGKGKILITALRIQLTDTPDNDQQALTEHHALRDYYLDLSNLENTRVEEVEALLDQFWHRFLQNDQRSEALDTLGLADPVDWDTIKQQHRRLAMQHHPDRGGDDTRLQAINAAMQVLTSARNR